jgi:3-isopropylmalate dehydrogenase
MTTAQSSTEPGDIRLLVLEGDGIGPEIAAATRKVLEAVDERCDLGLSYETTDIGFAALKRFGTTFPDAVLKRAREVDAIVLGPVSHNEYPPVSEGGLNPSGQLRKQLDLYANIRPAKSYDGLPPRCGHPVDLVVVRENTEGFYADRSMFMGSGEFMPTDDLALAIRKVTRKASMRIVESAFEIARSRRRKVTVVHKANVLRISDGLFLACAREVAGRYPDVSVEEKLIDAMAALLVRDASVFDVIVTTNMYGDILSDQASEIAGSLGMAASLNAGSKHGVAQAQHGSAPDLAGLDIANPSSLIGSAAMMLRWLGERRSQPSCGRAADMIDAAIAVAVSNPETRTVDLGGKLGTKAFTKVLINLLPAD